MKPGWPWEIKVNLAKTPSFTMRVHSPPPESWKSSTPSFMVLTCCSCVSSWLLSSPKVRCFARSCVRSLTTSPTQAVWMFGTLLKVWGLHSAPPVFGHLAHSTFSSFYFALSFPSLVQNTNSFPVSSRQFWSHFLPLTSRSRLLL